MAAFDYDCPTITNGFIANINQYANVAAFKAVPYTPWLANTPRGEWDRSRGRIQSSIVFGRTVPSDTDDDWADTVTVDDTGSTTACDLGDPEILDFGQKTRAMRRQRRYMRTKHFCLEELLDDFQIGQFLGGVMTNLRSASKYVWQTRRRREYSRLSEHKITERGSGYIDLGTASFDATTPPTSKLLAGTLEQIYDHLKLDGALEESSVGITSTGRRVLTLITSANTWRSLVKQDPELRDDFRFAFEGMGEKSPLVSAYGEGTSWNGYKPVIDYPRRFNITGGNTWVEVSPYKDPEAVTKGVDQPINPAYLYARYEESYVHIPSVYRELVQVPVSNPGGDFKFSAQNYMGDFMFQNILDENCNPRGKNGYFDAEFVSASEPGQTWLGFAIRHLNCLPTREPMACSSYESYS